MHFDYWDWFSTVLIRFLAYFYHVLALPNLLQHQRWPGAWCWKQLFISAEEALLHVHLLIELLLCNSALGPAAHST